MYKAFHVGVVAVYLVVPEYYSFCEVVRPSDRVHDFLVCSVAFGVLLRCQRFFSFDNFLRVACEDGQAVIANVVFLNRP